MSVYKPDFSRKHGEARVGRETRFVNTADYVLVC
jgi:hypothetical protein